MKPLSTANLGTMAMITVASGKLTPREPELVIRKTRLLSRSRGSISRRRSHSGTLLSSSPMSVVSEDYSTGFNWCQRAVRVVQPIGMHQQVFDRAEK